MSKLNLLFVAAIVSAVCIVVLIFTNVVINSAMNDAGAKALRLQRPVTDSVFGKPIQASFIQKEYVNLSVVICGDKIIGRKDLNKSKMVGHYVGEKTKQVVNGFWQGLTKKGKHSPGKNDKYDD